MRPSIHDPFRQPDCRAKRCQDLIARRKRPSRRLDDRWTWRAWRFLRALARAGDGATRDHVRRRRPALAAALDLRKGDDFTRWHLEARLLAKEPVGGVARRFGLADRAVEAYAALFFDVLGSLDARYWIVLRVIGYSPTRAFGEGDVETWLKLFGYMGGPHALDAFVDYFKNPEPVPDALAGIGPARMARVKRHLEARTAILARCVSDADPRMPLLGTLTEMLDAGRGGGGDDLSPLLARRDVLDRLLGP